MNENNIGSEKPTNGKKLKYVPKRIPSATVRNQSNNETSAQRKASDTSVHTDVIKRNNTGTIPPQGEDPKRQGNPKKKKKHSRGFLIFKKFVTVLMTTLLSLFLIMIITGTIVATALTVYVLDFMEETVGVTFQELEQGYNTYFYATDNSGEKVVLKQLKTDVQRIPVTIDQIPQNVRNAFVDTEDERFYSHDGVDYKRTFTAFLNMFIHIYNTDQGGSTITQQLVKNITGDNEQSPSRKIREIFRAMQLEKKYSKDQILEQYLNYIGFGGPINGIELASIRYFGKDVSELSTAEAASLAAIPKSPNEYGPFVYETDENTGEVLVDGKVNNHQRQRYVLWQIYKNGALTYDEYQKCLNEQLIYTDSDEYKKLHPENEAKDLEDEQSVYSWPVDAAMYEVADYLSKMYNIDTDEAINRINKGGYQIYLTVDLNMQDYVDKKFSDISNLMNPDSVRKWSDLDGDGNQDEVLPQAGFIAMNYKGEIKAIGGAIGEKTESLAWSYATREKRQVGSTMKPVSTYGLALLNDTIHWGSYYTDKTYMDIGGEPWPTNYSTDGSFSVSGESIPIYKAIQKSYNTIPAKLCIDLTPKAVYKFCTENLGMDLAEEDEDYSPLSVGALTYGITIENLVGAYLPYGNGGTHYNPHIVSRVEQGNHTLIYDNDGAPHQAVDSQTAWVMNRLLKYVVDTGTGTAAKLSAKEVCGKTGTTNDWKDLTFVGLTPDFISGVWIGYKVPDTLPSSLKSAQVWQNIIGEYANTYSGQDKFTPDPNVVEAPVCSSTGKIASSSCPKGITGYWKTSNAPVCKGGNYSSSKDESSDGGQQEATSAGSNDNQSATSATSNGSGGNNSNSNSSSSSSSNSSNEQTPTENNNPSPDNNNSASQNGGAAQQPATSGGGDAAAAQ